MKKSISVDTKNLLEIFCDINNLLVDCRESSMFGKLKRDSVETSTVLSRNSAIKGKIADILNNEFETTLFTDNIIPFEIKIDQVIKILEKGKL